MSKKLHISQTEIETQSQAIFKLAKYGENGIGICYPGCKIEYNVTAFLQNSAILKSVLGTYYKRCIFVPIFLTADSTYTFVLETIHEQLVKENIFSSKQNLESMHEAVKENGRELFVLFVSGHSVPVTALDSILGPFNTGLLTHSHIHAIFFIEANIFAGHYKDLFSKYTALLQNILYFPTYSTDESVKFVKVLSEEWEMKLSDDEITTIVSQCGGTLWFLREAVRCVRDNSAVDLSNLGSLKGIQMRAEFIFEQFSHEEKLALADIYDGVYEEDNESCTYFSNIVFIKKSTTGYVCDCQFFKQLAATYKSVQKIVNPQSIGDTTAVLTALTHNERKVFEYLLAHKGTIISREELGTVLWKDISPEKYSDWAIDKLLSRLRKAVTLKGFPDLIKTKKGQGFMIQFDQGRKVSR